MDSSTELMTTIAHQITLYVKEALTQHAQAGQPITLSAVESQLRECLCQAGRQALSEFLSTASGSPAAEIPCACGGTLQYQRRRTAVVLSVFGRVSYARAYYAGCGCGQGQAPLDKQYGIEPGQVSAGLAKLLSLAGVELPFEHSAQWLKEFLLFDIAENSVRRETQQMGQLQVAHEAQLQQQSQNEGYLQERLRLTRQVPPRLYGSIDAGKVRIEPRNLSEKQGDAEAWRDMKVGCWYEAEAVRPAQRSTRQREKYDRDQVVYRAKNIQYYCDITEAQKFGELMWATGMEAQADLARELVFVCDGALWIWNLIERYYPQAIQIVDWYHAADRLKRVAQAAFPHEAAQVAWLDQVTEDLWHGRVRSVILACQSLKRCDTAQAAATYFSNNEPRLRYDRFRAAGYLIGSGTVESGCKQIITQRLKCSGAQWTVQGAVLTAKARAAWLSRTWQNLCLRRDALPLAA